MDATRREISMTLKKYRVMNNLTQRELADLIGISLLSVQRYESGQRVPTVDIALKYGRVLKIPKDGLLDIFGKSSA